jgi:hypothetical protein
MAHERSAKRRARKDAGRKQRTANDQRTAAPWMSKRRKGETAKHISPLINVLEYFPII